MNNADNTVFLKHILDYIGKINDIYRVTIWKNSKTTKKKLIQLSEMLK